jgi:hypothetical protein
MAPGTVYEDNSVLTEEAFPACNQAQAIIQRITELTNIPEENSEYLQLLRYEEGQFYQAVGSFF